MIPLDRWDDLSQRARTGGALAVLGGAAIWLGGMAFAFTVALVVGAMVWELARMGSGDRSLKTVPLGVLASACVLVPHQVDHSLAVVVLAIPAVAAFTFLRGDRLVIAVCVLCVLVAGYGFIGFRNEQGALLAVWLATVVATTDVAGYFGGRIVGGRRFWPAVSPAKTWSGVVSGWLAAGLTGLAFSPGSPAGLHLVWVSVLVGIACQAGDLAESAVKRRALVKDSGGVLPGHGGLLDRFDGSVCALLFVTLVQAFR